MENTQANTINNSVMLDVLRSVDRNARKYAEVNQKENDGAQVKKLEDLLNQ